MSNQHSLSAQWSGSRENNLQGGSKETEAKVEAEKKDRDHVPSSLSLRLSLSLPKQPWNPNLNDPLKTSNSFLQGDR